MILNGFMALHDIKSLVLGAKRIFFSREIQDDSDNR